MSDDFTNDDEERPAPPSQAELDSKTASEAELLARLAELRKAHAHLDHEVSALQRNGVSDMLKIARMKKMKLRLKDQIAALEDQLTPDIIA